jgi:hypothetical protein
VAVSARVAPETLHRRKARFKVLTFDEARRIALNLAKLAGPLNPTPRLQQ